MVNKAIIINTLAAVNRLFVTLLLATILTPASYLSAKDASDSIERIEPAFWWVGFKNTSLQLMVHGEAISDYNVKVSHPGVNIVSVVQTKNPNYMFITLDISANAKVGSLPLNFTSASRESFTYNYALLARKANSSQRRGFDSSDTVYLITPDRFANSLPENDRVASMLEGPNRSDKDGRHGGDIKGIINNLDYIKDMGFTAIWSTPLLENNQPRTSYHGYAITDLYKTDPRFGSNEDYLELSNKMRERGMGLIMDMVANHIGSKHWWMDDLPAEDWINSTGDYIQSNHERTLTQGPHGSQIDKTIFSDGWFDRAMPDLNQRNPLLATYLIQNSIWWVEYADLYGIRMDTYNYPDKDFMSKWSHAIMEEYPNFNIVGEENAVNPTIVAYWQRGKVNSDGYISHAPSMMDIPLQYAMAAGLSEEEKWGYGLTTIYRALSYDWLYADPSNLMTLPDNHDMPRIFSQLNEDFDLYKMAIAHTLTVRGIPQVYYGTETLATSPKTRDDGLVRSDFPGGWAGDATNAFTGEGLTEQQVEAQAFVKRLVNWRKDKTVIHTGKLMHFIPENGTYVYFRYNDADKVMVIINKNYDDTTLPLQRYDEMLDVQSSWSDVVSGKKVKLEKSLKLKARSVTILELN